MFDEILKMVKDHFSNNPEIAAAIPPGQEDAVHTEIANHIANNLPTTQSDNQGGGGGLLGKLENAVSSGGMVTSAVEGGLVSSLASKFGLSPLITGAIAGAIPGLLQKFANRTKSPGL